ncbi:MAG: radical SAM protein [Candidatus Hydrogenedentes bacterium]|nr:radical SAM protein [Candidatus Hydrogenedentota bacterium]
MSGAQSPPPTTTRRVLTRRGVMWIGQTCNQRCYFCYFLDRIKDARHPEHAFLELGKLRDMARILREFYGCCAVDIQGGEPTIYPDIIALVAYCREIGLHPTLITNGIHLAKPGELEQYPPAGLRDFLVSLHGIGAVHDEVVGKPGAFDKITTAIGRMRDLGIPFRFNCTMSKPVVPLLAEVARQAIAYGARAVNYIAFNPFEDQEAGIRTHENVPRYSAIKPRLTEALDRLEEAGIECNVRYLPLCMAEPRHRKNFYNFQQLSYDLHEWDYQSWMWTGMPPQRMREGALMPTLRIGPFDHAIMARHTAARDWALRHPALARAVFGAQHALARIEQGLRGKDVLYREEAAFRAREDCGYTQNAVCGRCAARRICDGFHGDYAEFYGMDEAEAMTDTPPIHDPAFFICHQQKIVDAEDQSWAL